MHLLLNPNWVSLLTVNYMLMLNELVIQIRELITLKVVFWLKKKLKVVKALLDCCSKQI